MCTPLSISVYSYSISYLFFLNSSLLSAIITVSGNITLDWDIRSPSSVIKTLFRNYKEASNSPSLFLASKIESIKFSSSLKSRALTLSPFVTSVTISSRLPCFLTLLLIALSLFLLSSSRGGRSPLKLGNICACKDYRKFLIVLIIYACPFELKETKIMSASNYLLFSRAWNNKYFLPDFIFDSASIGILRISWTFFLWVTILPDLFKMTAWLSLEVTLLFRITCPFSSFSAILYLSN